jgi:O-antigen ligase
MATTGPRAWAATGASGLGARGGADRLEALRSRWEAERAAASRRRLWSVGFAVVWVVVLDVTGYSLGSGSGRYLLVLAPIALVCLVRPRHDRLTVREPMGPDWFVGLLLLYGLLGSLYGVFFGSARTPSLAVFLPMLLALLHLTTLGPVEDREAWTYLRWWALAGAVYVVLHAGTELGVLPTRGGAQEAGPTFGSVFRHEKSFLIAIALASAWLLGKRLVLAALGALTMLLFLAYPAGTYVLAAVIGVATLVATGRRSGRARVYGMAGLAAILAVAVPLQVTGERASRTTSFGRTYFDAVGKTDNTETRARLWGLAVERVRRSPIVGSGFTGDVSLTVPLSGRRTAVPPHNDFLQMAMGGGLVATFLLVGWIAATNAAVVRWCRRAAGSGKEGTYRLLRVLLVGYNSFFAVALVNPVMSKVGLSATVMVLYAMMMSVGAPPLPGPAGGGASRALRERRLRSHPDGGGQPSSSRPRPRSATPRSGPAGRRPPR